MLETKSIFGNPDFSKMPMNYFKSYVKFYVSDKIGRLSTFTLITKGELCMGEVQFVPPLNYKLNVKNEKEIKESIAGNLCRCTGYKQIIDAVEAV